jgi:hypothetical protein
VLNTAWASKSGSYIADVCKQVLAEVEQFAPSTLVSGMVVDSAAANRDAMRFLDLDATLHPMINLQCAAHTLNLPMHDIYKRFEWVRDVKSQVLFISSAINGGDKLRSMFQQHCLEDCRSCTNLAHTETRAVN